VSQPGSAGAEGDYFSLPYAYWRMGLQDRLDLPGKAVLLIALSRPDDFILPLEHGAKWYGISSDTIRSGLRSLQILGLLQMRMQHIPSPLTVRGYRTERHYTLRPPFGPRSRDGITPE
jgi:hypothetical protein